jgi:hypothetical protein
MTADLDHFGCENSGGTIIGREGLVELGHVPAYARRFLNQIYLEAGSGQIEGSLDPADPAAYDHYISKIVLCETFARLPRPWFFSHFFPSLSGLLHSLNQFLDDL